MTKFAVLHAQEREISTWGRFDSEFEAMACISQASTNGSFDLYQDYVYIMDSDLKLEEVSQDDLDKWRSSCTANYVAVLNRLKSMTDTVRQYLNEEWDGSTEGWWAVVGESERVINKAEGKTVS